ncbi:MAG: hypothetical protein PPP58_07380 [Natronomonas sp.]
MSTDDSERAVLGERATIPDAFELVGQMRVDDTTVQMDGRATDSTLFLTVRGPDTTVEQYVTPGELAVRTPERCIRTTVGGESTPDEAILTAFESATPDVPPPRTTAIGGIPLAPGAFERTVAERFTIAQSGESTVDGTDTRSFEYEPTEVPRGSETYHLGVNSGIIRRVESEVVDWEHHSWEYRPIESMTVEWNLLPADGIEPIDTPEQGCRSE